GGFDEAFYSSYHDAWPLEAGWEERVDLWNLYPMLVHVNLFGSSYVQELRKMLGRYIRPA
ncbi:MAG: fructosamine kinase family protein, partial [Bacteroidia bacterium]|nr:fructosamine kinase family protein [Bacteroidia bacterium]